MCTKPHIPRWQEVYLTHPYNTHSSCLAHSKHSLNIHLITNTTKNQKLIKAVLDDYSLSTKINTAFWT